MLDPLLSSLSLFSRGSSFFCFRHSILWRGEQHQVFGLIFVFELFFEELIAIKASPTRRRFSKSIRSTTLNLPGTGGCVPSVARPERGFGLKRQLRVYQATTGLPSQLLRCRARVVVIIGGTRKAGSVSHAVSYTLLRTLHAIGA